MRTITDTCDSCEAPAGVVMQCDTSYPPPVPQYSLGSAILCKRCYTAAREALYVLAEPSKVVTSG